MPRTARTQQQKHAAAPLQTVGIIEYSGFAKLSTAALPANV